MCVNTLAYTHARTHTHISIVSSYTLDGLGFEFRKGQQIFCSLKPSIPALDSTYPSIQWVPGISLRGKLVGA